MRVDAGFSETAESGACGGLTWDGMTDSQKQLNFSRFGTSGDFISTMGLKLLQGRDVDFNAYPSDSTACMLNETAATAMGLKNPIGKLISQGNQRLKLVGVFKDFIIN